jgi:hypothetical protein
MRIDPRTAFDIALFAVMTFSPLRSISLSPRKIQ